MRRTLIFMVTLLAFSVLPLTQAQEEQTMEKPTVDKPTAEVEKEQVEGKRAQEERVEEASADAEDGSQGSDDNFIPTEKINVDSSVSFPVDI